jgi:L-amino acid N-acyltransferase YncA
MSDELTIATPRGHVLVTVADGAGDLDGILTLQRRNLPQSLTPEAAVKDGFVTVVHTRDVLSRMHAVAPSVVARHQDQVVGYALTMPCECRTFVPVLEPMFAVLDGLRYRDRPLSETRYYVMGQICIAGGFRGTGLFQAMYAEHLTAFRARYDLIVTEISRRNARSLRAHERTGFETLTTYTDATDDWVVVGLPFPSDV